MGCPGPRGGGGGGGCPADPGPRGLAGPPAGTQPRCCWLCSADSAWLGVCCVPACFGPGGHSPACIDPLSSQISVCLEARAGDEQSQSRKGGTYQEVVSVDQYQKSFGFLH